MMDLFTNLMLAGVCLSAFAWAVVAHRRFVTGMADACLRLTHLQRVLVALAVIVCSVYAQKPSTNDVEGVTGTNCVQVVEGGTNGVDVVEGVGTNEAVGRDVLGAPQPPTNVLSFCMGCGALRASRPAVIRPYRLESVKTNEAYSYAMPPDATICGTWHLTGAYEDVRNVSLDGFAFPLGSDLCDHLWANVWGEVRPRLGLCSNGIAAVGASMSAIPDVSRFWTAETSNDTYLLTWENFAAGRVSGSVREGPDETVNAQIELKRNGDFITRSNDVECVYRRVIEQNPISPDNPVDPNNPLSSMYPYGPAQDLSVIGESNSYCWVDIVVNNADAWVRFEGDGPSNLADPSFAAKAGETNRVVILIGKTYKVTCDMPFAVVGKSDPVIDEWRENDNTLWLNWPVAIWAVGDDETGDDETVPMLLGAPLLGASGGGNGFTMRVVPNCLYGDFVWTNCCCSISGGGCHYSYNCAGGCSCGGCCATGYYLYEGYRRPACGGGCGCSTCVEPQDPHDVDPSDPLPPVGVFASFSKKVIFLENEYANTPSNVVPWYSDTSSLCCFANGGAHGGHVRIEISGNGNLIQFGGQTLPFERELEPFEIVVFTNTYKAVSESGGYEAIVVTATFHENDTGWDETSIAKATAVRVEVTPERTVNGCLNRHKWGVCERIICEATPSGQFLEFDASNGGDFETGITGASSPTLVCPDFAASGLITITVDGEGYTPVTTVETPASFRFGVARQLTTDLGPGIPGGAGMSIEVHVQPDYVSFMELRMREVPSNDSDIFGYFANTVFSEVWHHNRKRGAGTWHLIGLENYFFTDEAKMMDALMTPCSGGHIYWTIPIDWKRNSGPNGLDHRLVTIQQKFDMGVSGTLRVSKYGFWVERAIDGSTRRSEGVLP